MMNKAATHGFAMSYANEASGMCWACPAPLRYVTWRGRHPHIKGVDGHRKPRGNR
jgi:hypothetical protein